MCVQCFCRCLRVCGLLSLVGFACYVLVCVMLLLSSVVTVVCVSPCVLLCCRVLFLLFALLLFVYMFLLFLCFVCFD